MSESNEFEDVPGILRPPESEPVRTQAHHLDKPEEHPPHHHSRHFRMLTVEGDNIVEVNPDEIKTYDREEDVPPRAEPKQGDIDEPDA
jgi:hypothetical protein